MFCCYRSDQYVAEVFSGVLLCDINIQALLIMSLPGFVLMPFITNNVRLASHCLHGSRLWVICVRVARFVIPVWQGIHAFGWQYLPAAKTLSAINMSFRLLLYLCIQLKGSRGCLPCPPWAFQLFSLLKPSYPLARCLALSMIRIVYSYKSNVTHIMSCYFASVLSLFCTSELLLPICVVPIFISISCYVASV